MIALDPEVGAPVPPPAHGLLERLVELGGLGVLPVAVVDVLRAHEGGQQPHALAGPDREARAQLALSGLERGVAPYEKPVIAADGAERVAAVVADPGMELAEVE